MHDRTVRTLLAAGLVATLLLPTVLPAPGEARAAHVDPGLLGQGETPVRVIAQLDQPVSEALVDRLSQHGRVVQTYTVIDAAALVLYSQDVPDLAEDHAVWRVDADQPLELHLDTARPAIRVGDELWQAHGRGEDVTIAVVDTGIDSSHPSVQGRVVQGVVFTGSGEQAQGPTSSDADGHGTHVAGVAAGSGDGSRLLQEDRRYAGIAGASDLVSLDISQDFTTSTAIDAFDWIHENHEEYGIKVVQNSWGRKEAGQPYDPDDPAIRASNTLVGEDDLLVVFSAANAGPDPSTLSLEAQNPNVLTVAAVDTSGKVASFSSRGPVITQDGEPADWVKPDIAAPGVQIKSAAAGADRGTNLYKDLSGTSQAAPHAAGVGAMILAENPELSPLEVIDLLERTAHDLDETGPDPATGYGYLNAERALATLERTGGVPARTSNETYTSSGTLFAGVAETGLLPEETGTTTDQANGTFPVKENADRLRFRVTWNGTEAGTPPPELRVQLVDPTGTSLIVPSTGQLAERTIDAPASGTWGWRIMGEDTTDVGAASYHMTATVQITDPLELQGDTAGDGGFFDGDARDQAVRFFEDARATYGDAPVFGAIAALGILLLALLVAAVRS